MGGVRYGRRFCTWGVPYWTYGRNPNGTLFADRVGQCDGGQEVRADQRRTLRFQTGKIKDNLAYLIMLYSHTLHSINPRCCAIYYNILGDNQHIYWFLNDQLEEEEGDEEAGAPPSTASRPASASRSRKPIYIYIMYIFTSTKYSKIYREKYGKLKREREKKKVRQQWKREVENKEFFYKCSLQAWHCNIQTKICYVKSNTGIKSMLDSLH